MFVTGESGIVYKLSDTPLIKKVTGEGSVYAVVGTGRSAQTISSWRPGQPRLVAKIYHPAKRDAERQAKVRFMAAHRPAAGANAQLAWPLDVVRANGAFAGFIMPQVAGAREIGAYYTAGPCGVGGPAAGPHETEFARQVLLAYNLCVAVSAVHDLGQVVGDGNPNNILVDDNWNVTLIDCDSFHITDESGKVYRCAVGMGDYLPGEVLIALEQAAKRGEGDLACMPVSPYSQQTDLYWLAVHLFALLMNGCHPYACTVSRAGAHRPGIAENARAGFSPFFSRRPGLTTPVYAPSTSCLPADVRDLFKRAFAKATLGHAMRPTAREWAAALRPMLDGLQACPKCGMARAAGCECARCSGSRRMQKGASKAAAQSGAHTVTESQLSSASAVAQLQAALQQAIQAAQGAKSASGAKGSARQAAGQLTQSAGNAARRVSSRLAPLVSKEARACGLHGLLMVVFALGGLYALSELVTHDMPTLAFTAACCLTWFGPAMLVLFMLFYLHFLQMPQGSSHDLRSFVSATAKTLTAFVIATFALYAVAETGVFGDALGSGIPYPSTSMNLAAALLEGYNASASLSAQWINASASAVTNPGTTFTVALLFGWLCTCAVQLVCGTLSLLRLAAKVRKQMKVRRP